MSLTEREQEIYDSMDSEWLTTREIFIKVHGMEPSTKEVTQTSQLLHYIVGDGLIESEFIPNDKHNRKRYRKIEMTEQYPNYAAEKVADEIIKDEQNNDTLVDVTVDTANNALSILTTFVNSRKQAKIERIGEKISLLNDMIATSNSSRAELFQAIVDDLNNL